MRARRRREDLRGALSRVLASAELPAGVAVPPPPPPAPPVERTALLRITDCPAAEQLAAPSPAGACEVCGAPAWEWFGGDQLLCPQHLRDAQDNAPWSSW